MLGCVSVLDNAGWVRLYPINFRDLGDDSKFKKYDVVATARPNPNGIKLSWNRHQPEDDFRQRRQPGRLAVLAGLVAASGALGLAFVAASGAARNEMTVVGDLSGQVGGELVKELRGKSIRSR